MAKRPSKTPTGYSATTLPFHELEETDFERYCTNLLNLHPQIWCEREGRTVQRRVLSAQHLGSGTRQRGADFRADVQGGEVWFVQCKRVRSFGRADVVKAINELEQGKPQADQYILVTTCGLSDEARRCLDDRSQWQWWDGSRVTTLTQQIRPTADAISLVKRTFGLEWIDKLFPWPDQPLLTWQNYFARELSDEVRQFHHRLPFVPWGDALIRLEDFAKAGVGRALLLSAAGGQGKSRLLLELARRLDTQTDAPQVRFLNLNGDSLTESQTDFLARQDDLGQGRLLLIVEDAHRLDAALGQLAGAAAKAKSVSLLLATRPQAVESVRHQLFLNGYAEKIEDPLRLPRWKPSEMEDLARQALGPDRQTYAPRLAGLADGCPLLVVLGAAQVKSGAVPETMTDEEAFREKVFKGFIDDFLRHQAESKRDRLHRLIQILSFISPTPRNDGLFSHLAALVKVSDLEVADDLEALQAAGMLSENQEGIRLYPDLFADAVLIAACVDSAGHPSFLSRAILGRLAIGDFPALIRNLAQADWEARTRKGAKDSVFDPVWKEFERRFAAANWDGRSKLLRQWAGFAVYQPERTLELVELALEAQETTDPVEPRKPWSEPTDRPAMLRALPPLLEPIVVWHPKQAPKALDVLWSLAEGADQGDAASETHPITVIARAGGFEFEKPLSASESVIGWLDRTLGTSAGIERIRRCPSIPSTLLSPFFGRVVDNNWMTGNKFHLSSLPVKIDRTRPLRQRALAILERLVLSAEVGLVHAGIPILEKALSSTDARARLLPTAESCEPWRSDRLEALELVRKLASASPSSHLVLLQVRRLLVQVIQSDPDAVFRDACDAILAQVPNPLEVRLARALTSWTHDEIDVTQDSATEKGYQIGRRKWAKFCSEVAAETVARWSQAKDLCAHLTGEVREVRRLGLPVYGHPYMRAVAATSPTWCATLLETLLSAPDSTLDSLLFPVFQQAVELAPEVYRLALLQLPEEGTPPERLADLIYFLGWKFLHGGGLKEEEREAVVRSTFWTDATVVSALASAAGTQFAKEPGWAMEVLCRLKPIEEQGSRRLLEGLAHLVEDHASTLDPATVALCLDHLGGQLVEDGTAEEHAFSTIARRFPVQTYEFLGRLIDAEASKDFSGLIWGLANAMPALGPMDSGYVNRELSTQWAQVLAGDRTQPARLALVRSLLWSDASAAPDRLAKLMADSRNREELRLIAQLCATPGSRFVFQFPDLVRQFLVRAIEVSTVSEIREILWRSACEGGRGWSEGRLDPEYRYILEQAESLANRHRDDPHLATFYRSIIDHERWENERARQNCLDRAEQSE